MQIFFSVFWWIYFFIFFSGYPLLYELLYLAGKNKKFHHVITEKIFPLLPSTYAFVSTVFWILMLWTGRMDFVVEKIASVAFSSLVIAYSFTALLFWLPYFRRKTFVSLLHSLLLFLLPFLNMLWKTYRHKMIPHDYLLNLFRIYGAGFIIYIIAIVFIGIMKRLLSKNNFIEAT
jgi:hypothetical protein